MRIIGHGIDLVEIDRVADMVQRHGRRFLDRCFTPGELTYAGLADGEGAVESVKRSGMQHLAGRFAAKEAILKVLGTGWSQGIAWTDAEVVREPSGRPTVQLHGKCAAIARELGIEHWTLSITHTRTHAMASAIATD